MTGVGKITFSKNLWYSVKIQRVVEKILGSSQQSLERNVFSEWQEKCFAPEAACLVKEIAILALYNWRKYDANQQKFPLNLQRFFKSVAVAYRIST